MVIETVYWDANCFLGIFNNEQDKVKACKGTTARAEKGDLIIVTSAITLVEVIRMKGQPRLKREDENKIREFFLHKYILIQNVDRVVAEAARDLMWRHSALQPKDSIHVATAILRKVSRMHTFDEELLNLDNKYGSPKLHICKPDIPHQMDLGELYEERPKG